MEPSPTDFVVTRWIECALGLFVVAFGAGAAYHAGQTGSPGLLWGAVVLGVAVTLFVGSTER